jgi:hypothetical protein
MAGDAAAGAQRLAAHMSAAVALVAEEQALNLAEGQASSRLSPLIAIDQGEELFAAEDAAQSNRFLDTVGHLLGSPPDHRRFPRRQQVGVLCFLGLFDRGSVVARVSRIAHPSITGRSG